MNSHYPKLSALDFYFFRSPGPGMGNLLFPIASALSAAHDYKERFIFPTIVQLKLGTFIRSEQDKRIYDSVLKKRNHLDFLEWLQAIFQPKISISDYRSSAHSKNITIIHEGLGNMFNDFFHNRDLIRTWLFNNALTYKHEIISRPRICIHIRRGDYLHQNYNCDTFKSIDTNWYVKKLDEIYDYNSEVIIFTDGDTELIKDSFKGYDVKFDQSLNALDSILRLSTADYLIGSNSTFSLWGAFLSTSNNFIFHKKFDVTKYLPINI